MAGRAKQLDVVTDDAYYLAEFNISVLRMPLHDSRMADFIARLAPVNELADRSPGFVWRLKTESGDATTVHALNDPRILVNLSVWTNVESLRAFTYSSPHVDMVRHGRLWFDANPTASMCMWWITAGVLPTVAEAEERLLLLRRCGATPRAFSFAIPYAPDGSQISPTNSVQQHRDAS
jgi:heme-degrading monooxygenase HmoA